jgi:hypothetical protein
MQKLLDNQPVNAALAEARKRDEVPVLALGMLCTAAVDDLAPLVQALGDAGADARLFSSRALRNWIGLRPENDLKLFQLLQERYTALQAEAIIKLLHGFSREDWTTVATYEWLITKLDNDALIVRELALNHLLTHEPEGRKIRYDATASADLRKRGVKEWRQLLDSGKLPSRRPAK